jgi:hypothetical protein
MARASRFGVSLAVSAMATALSACADRTVAPPAATTRPTTASNPAATQAAAVRELIDRLAIANSPAGNGPVYTPSVDTPARDPRVIAIDAAGKLYGYGTVAYPHLLAALDDRRQSIALRAQLPATVGLACLNIIRNQICVTPEDYFRTLVRTGADGEEHDRPFTSEDLFDMSTVRAWLGARSNRSLASLQLEGV